LLHNCCPNSFFSVPSPFPLTKRSQLSWAYCLDIHFLPHFWAIEVFRFSAAYCFPPFSSIPQRLCRRFHLTPFPGRPHAAGNLFYRPLGFFPQIFFPRKTIVLVPFFPFFVANPRTFPRPGSHFVVGQPFLPFTKTKCPPLICAVLPAKLDFPPFMELRMTSSSRWNFCCLHRWLQLGQTFRTFFFPPPFLFFQSRSKSFLETRWFSRSLFLTSLVALEGCDTF